MAYKKICSKLEISSKSIARFIELYEKIPLVDGKKLWPFSKKNGYGQYTVTLKDGRRTVVQAHRLAYIVFVSDLEEGNVVCHKDDIRDNIIVSNLWVGSQKENVRDMYSKGRSNNSLDKATRAAKEKKTYLVAHEASLVNKRRFSEEDIRTIRRLYSEGETQISIAKKYGCSREPIYKIVKFKSYKHIV